MNLYSITPDNHRELHVVARNQSQAIDIFVTFEASRGRFHESLAVADIPVTDLGADQEAQVLDALVLGIPGVLHQDDDLGWVFTSPLCTPVGSSDLAAAGDEDGQ